MATPTTTKPDRVSSAAAASEGRDRPRRRASWIRTFDKHVLNPVVLLAAGRRHSADYAILRHIGRRSGRPYASPVVAHPVAGGFLIALPYGTDVDWLCNAQAAGRATIRHRGTTYTVGDPAILAEADALPLLAKRMRRTMGRLHIARYVRMRRLDDGRAGV